jgi:hypothetical protein
MLHCEINSKLRENCIIEYAIETADINIILDNDKTKISNNKPIKTKTSRKTRFLYKTVVRTENRGLLIISYL